VPDDNTTQLAFTGPADPGCLDHIHALLTQLWERAPDVASRDRSLFATAVAEVAANIVEHGQGAGRTIVSLTLRVDGDQMEATFSDDGIAADLGTGVPSFPSDLEESGRGLAITRAAVDVVGYERAGGVNTWHLVRRRRDDNG
jgi:serine/threonine-protein kinase RsbW